MTAAVLSKEDKKIIVKVSENDHFDFHGSIYFFYHTVAETQDYLSLEQAKLLLYYVSKYGKDFLEKFHYKCRPIYWQGCTYHVPDGTIEGTFPNSGFYGSISPDGSTAT
jgi:hypothetical protein